MAFGDIPPVSPTSEQPPRDRPHGVGEAGSHVPGTRLTQAVGPRSAPGCCGCMLGRWIIRRAPEPFPFWASLCRRTAVQTVAPCRLVKPDDASHARSHTDQDARVASYGSLSLACWLAGEISTWGVVVIPAFLPASRGALLKGRQASARLRGGVPFPHAPEGVGLGPVGRTSNEHQVV